jgi:hypothetical protein
MEKLATNKHSILLRRFVNYGQKSFINLAPGSVMVEHFEGGVIVVGGFDHFIIPRSEIYHLTPGPNVIKLFTPRNL